MLKAVITTLLLGTSTVAVADPQPPYSSPPYSNRYPGDYDRRYEEYPRNSVYLARNVVLGSRRAPALWIPIDARLPISRVRVRLASGSVYIQRVTLVYTDGHREAIPVHRTLSTNQRRLTIELTHRGVRGVLIDSAPMRYARGGFRGGWPRHASGVVDVMGLR